MNSYAQRGTRGRLRTRAAIALAAGAAVAALPAAPASAAQSCRSASTARGASVVTTSQTAVAFANGRHYYGCLYRKGKVRKLPVECCFPERFALGGRHVAYTYRGSAEGDETDRIGLYDLKTGKVKNLSPDGGRYEPNVVDTSEIIHSFFVRPNGTLAWLQTSTLPNESEGPNQVHVLGPDGVNRVIDEGNIPDGALALSSDSARLYWLKDGAPQFAVLP